MVRDGAALLVRQGPFLVRVRPRTAVALAVAQREVLFAKTFTALNIAVTPLVDPEDQPWEVDGHVVTGWAWIDAGVTTTAADLGLLARTLRERTAAPAASVPSHDPLGVAVTLVAHQPDDDPEACFVRDRAESLGLDWAEAVANDPLGRSIVHGDLHVDNVVASPTGPLLTDLEFTGAGGASYDATPAVMGVQRYGASPAELDQFLHAFGRDPRPWTGFGVYLQVYELMVTAWAVGVREREPAWATEATRRIESLRDGADHQWKLH